MEVSLVHTKPSHLVVVLLVLTALQHCVAQDETPTFSNCYGRQCEVGEFCSQSEPFHGCRLCTEVSVWCTQNISHVREKFSTCLTVCELLLAKSDMETMQSEMGEMKESIRHLEIQGRQHFGLSIAAYILPVVVGLILMCWWTKRGHGIHLNQPQQTASVKRTSLKLTLKSLCCQPCPPHCTRRRDHAHQPVCDPEAPSVTYDLVPSSPEQCNDSGNSSNSSSESGSRSSLAVS